MASVTHLYQEHQRRTWCWKARKALAGLEGLLHPPAPARDLDQAGQRHQAGRVQRW
jgi:hypothetical protein